MFEAGLDTLAFKLDTLARAIDSGSQRRIVSAFQDARFAYKRIEGVLRYYSPEMAGGLDGPLPELDEDAPPRPLGSPAAFQIVEADVFPAGSDSLRRIARDRAAGMAIAVRRFRGLTTYLAIEDAPLLEAARLEIARVSTIDLAGVDLEHSDQAVVEAATALDGVRLALSRQAAGQTGRMSVQLWSDADTTFAVAASYLRGHPNFERLDRLTFITGYARPAAEAIAAIRASVPTPRLPLRNPWRQEYADGVRQRRIRRHDAGFRLRSSPDAGAHRPGRAALQRTAAVGTGYAQLRLLSSTATCIQRRARSSFAARGDDQRTGPSNANITQ